MEQQESDALREQAIPGNEEDPPPASAHEAIVDNPEGEEALGADAPAPEPTAQMPLPARLDGMIKTRRQRMIVYTVMAALAGLLTAWFFGSMFPNYLLYDTPAIKADAVVLFLGPSEAARRKQVDALVVRGMAKLVIVPWEGRIYATDAPDNPIETVETTRIAEAIKFETHRSWVERTHVEIRQAHALMDHIGATSANLVSSPYHMRRIKIMTGRLSDTEKYKIAFVPTAYEPRHVPWFLAWQDVKWVFSEWGKIVWYFIYSPFV